jgi:hypothetical protein
MKKLLLVMLLAAFASVTTTPILGSLAGFGPGTAYAGDNNDQGENDDPGMQ